MITWTRQEDGSYVRSGELPEGTKWVTTEIAGRPVLRVVRRVKDAVEIIENAIATGYARAEEYYVLPANAVNAMSEETKEALRSKQEAEKAALTADNETHAAETEVEKLEDIPTPTQEAQ